MHVGWDEWYTNPLIINVAMFHDEAFVMWWLSKKPVRSIWTQWIEVQVPQGPNGCCSGVRAWSFQREGPWTYMYIWMSTMPYLQLHLPSFSIQ